MWVKFIGWFYAPKGYCLSTPIHHFTVVCLVAWLLNESEAGVVLVLIETSLLFLRQSAHVVRILIFPSEPIFHAMNFGLKNFDLDKKRFFNEVLNLKILFYCGLLARLTTSLTCSDL